jgi:hypothetical protein
MRALRSHLLLLQSGSDALTQHQACQIRGSRQPMPGTLPVEDRRGRAQSFCRCVGIQNIQEPPRRLIDGRQPRSPVVLLAVWCGRREWA